MARRDRASPSCSPRSRRISRARSPHAPTVICEVLYASIEAGVVRARPGARDRRAAQPWRVGIDRRRRSPAGSPATRPGPCTPARSPGRSTLGLFLLVYVRARAAAALPHPPVPRLADDRRPARRAGARRARLHRLRPSTPPRATVAFSLGNLVCDLLLLVLVLVASPPRTGGPAAAGGISAPASAACALADGIFTVQGDGYTPGTWLDSLWCAAFDAGRGRRLAAHRPPHAGPRRLGDGRRSRSAAPRWRSRRSCNAGLDPGPPAHVLPGRRRAVHRRHRAGDADAARELRLLAHRPRATRSPTS